MFIPMYISNQTLLIS